LLIRMGPHRILLDCGLRDLTPLIEQAGQKPPADVVLCSHAHPDHAQGLLDLHEVYPQIPIYASEITAQLLPLNWMDRQVPPFCQALPWQSPVDVRDGLTVELWPSGHLPGAACFLLTYTTAQRPYTVFFTGDFFLSNSRLVDGMPLDDLRGLKPNVLIVEGSYGTARYPHRRQQENQLAERLYQMIAANRSVLLPTPTIGLGQELLMLLRSHHHFTGRNLDIWVEETVAAGCDAYLELLPHFPSSVQNFARHQPLFWDERIRPRVRRLQSMSQLQQAEADQPVIVIAHYGANLEPVLSHLPGEALILMPQQPRYVGSNRLTAAEEQLLQYQPPEVVAQVRSQLLSQQMGMETYLLTEHCDGPGTTQLIHNLRPQHVVFIHGSPVYLSDLTALEELQNRYHLHIPAAGTRVELPVGDTFLQPAPPETVYEGELTQRPGSITVLLPDEVMNDPRWANLADTGIVEARWQGENLVIRGVSQQELLQPESDYAIATEIDCCDRCLHYRGQHCWNAASPLYSFKVTPDGYCPAFERLPEGMNVPPARIAYPLPDQESDASQQPAPAPPPLGDSAAEAQSAQSQDADQDAESADVWEEAGEDVLADDEAASDP
jgi:Cft2 family RNA processing exonuclease